MGHVDEALKRVQKRQQVHVVEKGSGKGNLFYDVQRLL